MEFLSAKFATTLANRTYKCTTGVYPNVGGCRFAVLEKLWNLLFERRLSTSSWTSSFSREMYHIQSKSPCVCCFKFEHFSRVRSGARHKMWLAYLVPPMMRDQTSAAAVAVRELHRVVRRDIGRHRHWLAAACLSQ